MSISVTLRKAAQLQDKIEVLRGQLAETLNQARSELTPSATDETPAVLRRGRRPKMLKASLPKQNVGRGRGRPRLGKNLAQPAKTAVATKSRRRSPLAGHKRSSSPSGPLAPAVVKVLQSKGKSMNVRDILDQLLAGGYKFNSPEPKKNLAARIYRLSGVKQVAPGLFGPV